MIKVLEKKSEKAKQKRPLLLGQIRYFSRLHQLVPANEKKISGRF